jgi:manganese-dependent inorganic pyrophosphatase
MGPILVLGHRNPDNDSICSAVAYAHLKNLADGSDADVYVPGRLGPVPAETEWVFRRFGLQLPEIVSQVHTRVKDVMTADVATIAPERSMLEAGRLMRERDVRALPVVEDSGALVGIVSQRMLAERYLEETEIAGFGEVPVSVERLTSVVDGELLAGDPAARVSGNVLIGAAEPQTLKARIRPGDVLIVGDRVRTQPMAIEAGVAVLIVTTGAAPAPEVVALAKERGAALISTAQDTYSAARLVALAHAVGDLMDRDVLRVGDETYLSEAAEDLLGSPHREAVVLDGDGRVAGVITRTNVARGTKRRVVLVDHNELSQSAPGIEDAEIVEIVDHHRVGDVETPGPILFLNLPVGATATIVAERYAQLGVQMPEAMAGILLSAVLTDTVLLKSPTTTDTDRAVSERLAKRLGLDPVKFGIELFHSRASGQPFSADKTVRADVKEYRTGDLFVAIAQYESVGLDEVKANRAEILAALESLRASKGYDLALLMATDIVAEGSELIAVGKTRVAERALGIDLSSGSAWMPGVLSRKKQVAAPVLEAASQ